MTLCIICIKFANIRLYLHNVCNYPLYRYLRSEDYTCGRTLEEWIHSSIYPFYALNVPKTMSLASGFMVQVYEDELFRPKQVGEQFTLLSNQPSSFNEAFVKIFNRPDNRGYHIGSTYLPCWNYHQSNPSVD